MNDHRAVHHEFPSHSTEAVHDRGDVFAEAFVVQRREVFSR